LGVSNGGVLGLFQQGTVTTQVVASSLTSEGSSILLYSTLVLSNGRRLEVSTSSGLTYSTLDAAQVSVSGHTATVAVGATAGTAQYVAGQWRPTAGGSCTPTASASGNATLDLALPTASGVKLSMVPARLVVPGTAAALAGVATSFSLTVTLEFVGGTQAGSIASARAAAASPLRPSSPAPATSPSASTRPNWPISAPPPPSLW
jgi:hypothetical protein